MPKDSPPEASLIQPVPSQSVTAQSREREPTLIDVQLAAAYYPILVDLARHKHTITYSELIDRAKAANPLKEVVQRAIPTSAGRRLDVVRMFTNERGLPDLTSLVVSMYTGECGDGFTATFDPKAIRAEVLAFDWSQVATDFNWFVTLATKAATPKRPLKPAAAKDRMYTYYCEHRAALPERITDQRDPIVRLLMAGYPADEAFEQAVAELQDVPAAPQAKKTARKK